MTLRLIVMRHAKSSWDDPLLPDFERTLNKRGLRNAATMGRWLAETGTSPTRFCCRPLCAPHRPVRACWMRREFPPCRSRQRRSTMRPIFRFCAPLHRQRATRFCSSPIIPASVISCRILRHNPSRIPISYAIPPRPQPCSRSMSQHGRRPGLARTACSGSPLRAIWNARQKRREHAKRAPHRAPFCLSGHTPFPVV